MKKGGRINPVGLKQSDLMNSHIVCYYKNLMNSVDTGCEMRDYCQIDVYLTLMLRNLL